MIINRQTTPFTVFGEDTVLAALTKITDNKSGIVFCVDEHGMLTGSFSDGDFRRWITSEGAGDMTTPVQAAANKDCIRANLGADVAAISGLFRPGVEVIPLVDERGHLAAVATEGAAEMTIGRHTIGEGHPSLLIAEIGNNHQGDVKLAKHLVDLAREAGADAVKFQLRDMDALYRQAGGATAGEDLGAQYTLNLLAKFSLSPEQMIDVFDHCKAVDIDAFCTPWDLPSLKVLADYGVPALKIASADMTNHSLLRACAAEHLPMLVSTGMSTEDEILGSVAPCVATSTPVTSSMTPT